MLRLLLVASLTLMVAGAAWAGPACDKEKAASTEKASVQGASADHCGAAKTASASTSCSATKMASAEGKTCTAAEKAACEAKKAAMAGGADDCPMCCFMAAYAANKGKVTMAMQDTENGVTVVFAAVSKDDVATAQTFANQAYAVMNMSPECAVTKQARAESSCTDCKKGLEAFSNTKVTVENTDNGAKALVKVENKDQIAKVHAFFAGLGQEEKTQG